MKGISCTLIATMHSRVLSFFTQVKEGAAATRSKHFRYSWLDFTHHFTLATGLASTEAAKPNPSDALVVTRAGTLIDTSQTLMKKKNECDLYRGIRAAPRGGEASCWRRWLFRGGAGPPGLRSWADGLGGSCSFYSSPDWTRTTDKTPRFAQVSQCVRARTLACWRAAKTER